MPVKNYLLSDRIITKLKQNMKHPSIITTKFSKPVFPALCLFCILVIAGSCHKIKDYLEPQVKITTIAKGFAIPIGVEADQYGRIWVAEMGTGKNDGKVSVVTKDGKKYPVYTGFDSYKIDNGEIEGPGHLLISNGVLYIVGSHSKLYKANPASYLTGDPVKDASTLPYEEIGPFVLDYNFKYKIYETHAYGITAGDGGNLYLTDAAANAILRRSSNGVLSVVTEFPPIANPTPVGPPQIHQVPTSLYYDGQNLLVTTLTGFPFLPGKATVYKLSTSGALSVYQPGFTTLVDIAEGGRRGKLVLEHGQFGQMGFVPNSGRLVWANGSSMKELTGGLNRPGCLKQVNDHTWYVTSVGDGSLLKVTYD
jgi:hypothetical protein